MNCPKCGTLMFISSWDGWIWTCGHCDHQDRPATDQEVEKHERELRKNELETYKREQEG